jgi:hypothetical protein
MAGQIPQQIALDVPRPVLAGAGHMDQTPFIESIFNYCNRRCERCAFTERCLLYDDLREYEQRHPERRPLDQAHDKFQECFRLLERWCEREGIDFAALEREAHSEQAAADMERLEDAVRAEPLQKLATAYTHAAFKLVDALSAARTLRAWPRDVGEAIDTIAWNAGMVSTKVHRALHGLAEREDPPAAGDEDDGDGDVVQSDWNGSAKVARLLVAESRDAWVVVIQAGGAASDSPLTEVVTLLDRIDRGIANRFPRAMEFLRPGFDGPREIYVRSE